MKPFQTQSQLRALRVHAALSKAYHFVVDPVMSLFDSHNTDIFREKPSPLKVVK